MLAEMHNKYKINEGYQEKDVRVADYKLAILDGYPIPFRGPIPETRDLEAGSYFSVVGAAQAFGRFAQFPFASLLSASLNLSCLNLGMAGAGPRDFESSDFLIDRINGGRFCVVQVMSARSVENSMVFCPFGGLLTRRDAQDDAARPAEAVWGEILATRSPSEALELVRETQTNYVAAMRSLMARINIPVILLWFSRRKSTQLKKVEWTGSAKQMLGSFPHLVTEEMFHEIARCADHVCESASSFGLPQTLRDYRGARGLVPVYPHNPVPHENGYYPSQEMHAHCAMQLMALVNATSDFPGTRRFRPSDNDERRDRSRAYARLVEAVAAELPLQKALAAGSFALYARDAVLNDKLETLAPGATIHSRTDLPLLRETQPILVLDPDEERIANQLKALKPPRTVFRFADDAFPSLATQRRVDGARTAPPKRHYAVFCTPRSGSTYLCDLLATNGAGKPREHIRRAARLLRLSGQCPQRFLDRIISFDDGGETFGTKFISEFLIGSGLLDDGAAFSAYLGRRNFRLIRLLRDNSEQAVSQYLAQALKHWHARSDAERAELKARQSEVEYDFSKIFQIFSELQRHDVHLSKFLSDLSLPLIEIKYADLCDRPREVLGEVLEHVGCQVSEVTLHATQVVRKLDDHVSRQFRARFLQDLALRNNH